MKKYIALLISIALILSLGATIVFAASDNNNNQAAVDREDVSASNSISDIPADINSAGAGREYDLSMLEKWFEDLQAEIKMLIADEKLTQEQAEEIKAYYVVELSDIKGYVESGGVTAFDKTDSGLMEVFYEIEQVSFEPPALSEVFEWYARKGSFLSIATNLPLNN